MQTKINKRGGRTYLILPPSIFRDLDIKEVVIDFKESPFILIVRAAGIEDIKTFKVGLNGEYTKMIYFNINQISFDPAELEGVYDMEIDGEEYIFTRVLDRQK